MMGACVSKAEGAKTMRLHTNKSFVGAAFLVLATLLAPSPAATATGDSIPKHVPTWAYDGGYGGLTDGTNPVSTNPTSQRHIQTWLSFAEAGIGVNGKAQKAFYDCPSGSPCKNVVYYDPVKLFSGCWPDRDFISQNPSEDYYLHDSSPASPSNRTTRTKMACGRLSTVYYPNWNNPNVGQWFARHYLWLITENTNTMMFQDDSGVDCKGRFRYGQTYTPSELGGGPSCEASLAAALRNVANQLQWEDGTPVLVVANGFSVSPTKPANVASVDLIAPGSHIIGGVEENGEIYTTKFTPRVVFGDVNTASLVYNRNPNALYGFLSTANPTPGSTETCTDSVNNTENNCGALQLRRDMLASYWLAYEEAHTILWENFTFSGSSCCGGPHTLAVYPEASIYPSEPMQRLKTFNATVPTTDGSGCGAQPGSGGIQSFVVKCGVLNDGVTPAGVYVREFRRCYNFGVLIGTGQCAVVMNTTNAVVPIANWFSLGYTHIMTLGTGPRDGADVLTAGCGDSRCPTSALDPLGEPFTLGSSRVPPFDAVFLFHD